ncbi:molybdopterin-binding protein [Haloarcula laminariae]|uniref:molybdopterin-binding protein n=1 Tax=Haloarcula laminariae TaxID=2961577 RepID=UPI00240512B8|nr:molybdopterin-binding protein [Halomicroarcula sp. FL173]
MVDFQSRDTRRGPTDDADSSSETADVSEDDADADKEPSEPDEDTVTETADAGVRKADDPLAEDATTETVDATEQGDGDPLAEDTVTETADAAAADPLAGDAGPDEAGAADTGADRSGSTDAAAQVTDAEAADPLGGPAGGDESAGTEADATGSGPEQPATDATPQAAPARSVDVAVVTVSGDRESLEDTVAAAFETAGHAVVRRERLRGGYDGIQEMVDTLVGREAVDVVVTVGGVGLSADEMAVEAVHPLLEKALPGFGEAFRSRLADHVGTGIVGVRSAAGVSDGTLVFCLPGDAEAAALAVREILATEAPVLVDQLDG